MQSSDLVLGIDGGGTKTSAWLARRGTSEEPTVVGRGAAGATNPQTVGFDVAIENLNRAVDAAFDDAQHEQATVVAAVLALAGSDREENRRIFRRWADERHLAHRFRIVNDALPLLATASPECWGVALIAGTGSFCFAQDRDGQSTRVGGWGYLFGDEGSGYAVALAGLRAVAQAADGRGTDTKLVRAFLKRLNIDTPEGLILSVYPMAADRATIASLADVVTRAAADHDEVA
ncbi:MAG: N-acetylglucosamine kinase, partial [Pirellulales bacterium]|nr:N-acetylglucosamine kinase [Pirellulales bacterium]